MAKALQRHERGDARVIPVILRPCRWRSTPLAKLQAVPRDGKPVTDWLSRDTAFDDIAAAIERIIEDQQKERLRAAEEERRRAEEETKRKAEGERKRREQEEAEARRKAEEEERRRAEAEAKRQAEEREHRRAEEETKRKAEGEKPKPGVSKWIVAAAVVLVVVLGAIFVGLFPDWPTVPPLTAEKERPVTPNPSADAPKAPPPDVTQKTTADAPEPAPDVAKTTEEPPRTFRDCEKCPEMVVIPGGSFMMGSPPSEGVRHDDEKPQRQVTIKPFAIGKDEMTFDEWDACVAAGGCNGYRPSDIGWGRGL
jgi:formylglycine-generating enzyme required for sulfatase activity